MDIESIMILVKGQDKTQDIKEISDYDDRCLRITYISGRDYIYNKKNVNIFRQPEKIELNGRVGCIDSKPIYGTKLILDFGPYIRIIKHDNTLISIKRCQFSFMKNDAKEKCEKKILDYLNDIAQYTANKPKEEAFLQREMSQLTSIHPESVLSYYLNHRPIELRTLDINSTIFPFRFNLSQKAALEKALTYSISVIEGPPGTGKTQTILNLIANFVAVQGKKIAVVSNNNEAVNNVIEKMTEHGYGFLAALLGKNSNQDKFFENMPVAMVDGWNCEEEKSTLIQKIESLNVRINTLLKVDRKRAQLYRELRAWQLEQKHFNEYYSRQYVDEKIKIPLFRATPSRIISFLAETFLAQRHSQSHKILYRLNLFFKYGIFNYKKMQQHQMSIVLLLQREFYRQQIIKLKKEIGTLETKLDKNSFNELLDMHQQYSEKLFRKYLFQRYDGQCVPAFTKQNFKANFERFIRTFPVIFSTTHALRRSIPKNYLLDYVIIDEASQVDILTGVLAFSCCQNVIIVGDTNQLSQITAGKIEQQLKTKPLRDAYNYFQYSILSSITCLYGDTLPCETLREHYRCHPKIIEFCNQKYYGGKLIPYTEESLDKNPLMMYKTVEGNYMRQVTHGKTRGNYNQRELDVTIEEVLKNPDFLKNHENIGFVTPYRKQADKAEQMLPEKVQSDTVHKYQGREKDIMIMSTVLDNTHNGRVGIRFVDDPHMINVAVSRAIKKFILVTDHDLFLEKSKEIGDLIRYIQYNTLDENIIESDIVSVFDLLYQKYSCKLSLLKEKMNQNALYKSEEILRVLLEEILAEPQNSRYSYVHGMMLRNLLNTVNLLTDEELKFVNNRASLDFVVYYKQDKKCALVIEVDGFAFHENNPRQKRRDDLKNTILEKYNIPLLRLPTNGSREQEKIQRKLNDYP